MSDGGKGDKPRPLSVSLEEFDNRFEAIFGKKKKQTEETVTMRMPGTMGAPDMIFKDDSDEADKV
jgi:hypothetical protein